MEAEGEEWSRLRVGAEEAMTWERIHGVRGRMTVLVSSLLPEEVSDYKWGGKFLPQSHIRE